MLRRQFGPDPRRRSRQNDIVTQRQALPHKDVAAAIETMRVARRNALSGWRSSSLVLTAPAPVRVRLATWDEIDPASAVWTISAAWMKAKREHRAPLCRRALEVLDAVRVLGDGNRLVFPMRSGREIAALTLPKMLHSSTMRSSPFRMASGRRSGTGPPRRRTTRGGHRGRAGSCRPERSRRPTRGRTCSSGAGG